MGKLVYVRLGIEETAFIPVIRVLKSLPGCADLDWNMDTLDPPRGGQRGARKANGHAPTEAKPGIARLIVEAIQQRGPLPRSTLADIISAAGFAGASINSALHGLRKANVTLNQDGLWHLTSEFEAKMREATAQPQPAPQLPPPAKKKRATPHKAQFKATEYVLAAMRNEPHHQFAKEAVVDRLAKHGFKASGAWPVLHKLKTDSFIKPVRVNGKTFYELTAAGKKAKLPAELMKE